MSKVVLFAASLLLVAGIATAGIINPCNSPVVYNGNTPECWFACPQGDGTTALAEGFWFGITVNDLVGVPIPFIPGTDFWVIDCDPARNLTLCAGSSSSNADSATNSQGKTSISLTTLAVGGCANGVSIVVQGYVLQRNVPPCTNYCFDGTGGLALVRVRSCDLTGNLVVDLGDLAQLAAWFPPNPYNQCGDFDCNGLVNLGDLARFSAHFGPPGHKC
jgi:hypothetical protein